MPHDKMLVFKNVDCHGGKQSKYRLTVLVCTYMTGTEKATPSDWQNIPSEML